MPESKPGMKLGWLADLQMTHQEDGAASWRTMLEELHEVTPDYEVVPGFTPETVWPSGTLHLREPPLVFPGQEAP